MRSNKNVGRLLKKWQRRLRLESWDISIEVKEDAEYEIIELSAGHSAGTSSAINFVTGDRNDSNIIIKKSCSDYELFLVHELVHILVNPLDDASVLMLNYIPHMDIKNILSDTVNDALEKTVWSITRALKTTFANSE